MIRGELSNRPAPRFGVDYRILLDTNTGSRGSEMISSALMAARLQGFILGRYSVKDGASDWILRNFEYRAVGFVVGDEKYQEMIAEVLYEVVPEVVCFADKHEFRVWVDTSFEVLRVFTNDPELLGLDEVLSTHSGWRENIDGL